MEACLTSCIFLTFILLLGPLRTRVTPLGICKILLFEAAIELPVQLVHWKTLLTACCSLSRAVLA